MTSRLACACFLLVACGGDDAKTATPDAPPVTQHDAPPPIDAPSLTCTQGDPTGCSGETICVGTRCEPAFDRIYHFSSIAITAAAQNQGGSAWDPLGGAPDPFVVVTLNGTAIITTANVSDVFSASYTESSDTQIVAGSTLRLQMFDADTIGNDTMLDCTLDPLSAEALRSIVVHCDGTGTEAGSSIAMNVDVKG